MVLGAAVGLIVLVMALAGSKIARQAVMIIVFLMAAALLAIWFFLPADPMSALDPKRTRPLPRIGPWSNSIRYCGGLRVRAKSGWGGVS